MKAILVVDIGNDDINSYEVCIFKINRDTEIEWEKEAKLKPLPQKLDANDWHRMFGGLFSEREAKGYGWNACLEEIEE
jgi:ABC-type lipoprotein release transport system permease subunit